MSSAREVLGSEKVERSDSCAFAEMERIRTLYAHAIRERYRFFSYGDAMLLSRLR